MTKLMYNLANLFVLVLITAVIYVVIRFAGMLPVEAIAIDYALSFNVLFIGLCILVFAFMVRSAIKPGKSKDQLNRIERGATYKRFVDYFYSGLPMDDGWHDLTAHMTLWAPDTVLKHYLVLIKMLEEKHNEETILRKAEKVIMEIRRDWGYSNWGIIVGDLAKTANRFEMYNGPDRSYRTGKTDIDNKLASELESFKVATQQDDADKKSSNGVMH